MQTDNDDDVGRTTPKKRKRIWTWVMIGVAVAIATATVVAVVVFHSLFYRKSFGRMSVHPGPEAQLGDTEGPFLTTISIGSESLRECVLMAWSVRQFEPTARLYVYTNNVQEVLRAIPWAFAVTDPASHTFGHGYAFLGLPGSVYAMKWTDMQYKKAATLEHVLVTDRGAARAGAWFLDSDFLLLAPLSREVKDVDVALCPHGCQRPSHAARFGRYNGGMVFMKNLACIHVWRQEGFHSRFHEQTALEDVATFVQQHGDLKMLELDTGHDVGWWRFNDKTCLQEPHSSLDKNKWFSLCPGSDAKEEAVSVCMSDGTKIKSLHVHFGGRLNARMNAVADEFTAFLEKHSSDWPLAGPMLGEIKKCKRRMLIAVFT